MSTPQSQNLTTLDYDEVKQGLRSFLKTQDRFKDYDFDGSNISMIIDLLAYNTYNNNFYTHMALSEMFLDSSELRESVVSHAKHLNYLPRSRKSAKSTVSVTVEAGDSPASITIPERTQFLANCGNKRYLFYNEISTLVLPSDGTYVAEGLEIYEGRYLNEYFTVTGDDRFALASDTIDTDSIRVFVKDSPTSVEREYTRKDAIYNLSPKDEVFFVQAYMDDRYEVEFGRNVFGKEPPINGEIRILYRTTKGEEANGIDSYQVQSNIGGYTATVSQVTPSEGGAERESTTAIKHFAPKSIQVQERAITEKDYEILIKSRFPQVRAIAAYGGEELYPPQYGRVVVSICTGIGDSSAGHFFDDVRAYIKEKTPIGIEPIITQAKFLYIDVRGTISYNKSGTNMSDADVLGMVKTTAKQYSEDNLQQFNQTLRYSKLIKTIDNADENLVGVDLTLRAIIEIMPEKNAPTYILMQFKNELDPDLTYNDEQIDLYKPTIVSSIFKYAEKNVFLQDNGSGQLNIMETKNNKLSFVERNVGSVDYATGDVSLRNIAIQDWYGTGIKFYARLKNKDITCPKDRVMVIREADISLNLNPVRV